MSKNSALSVIVLEIMTGFANVRIALIVMVLQAMGVLSVMKL